MNWKWAPITSSARRALVGKSVALLHFGLHCITVLQLSINIHQSQGKEADDVALFHWVKLDAPDYRYAKFNRPIKLLDYTNEVVYLLFVSRGRIGLDWIGLDRMRLPTPIIATQFIGV